MLHFYRANMAAKTFQKLESCHNCPANVSFLFLGRNLPNFGPYAKEKAAVLADRKEKEVNDNSSFHTILTRQITDCMPDVCMCKTSVFQCASMTCATANEQLACCHVQRETC